MARDPTENTRMVMKPPRPVPGALQTLPTLPWMFSWPASAEERLRLTNHAVYGDYPYSQCPATSYPYRANWQFRDRTADHMLVHNWVDMRGGPCPEHNVAEKVVHAKPDDCRPSTGNCCSETSTSTPPRWFYQ